MLSAQSIAFRVQRLGASSTKGHEFEETDKIFYQLVTMVRIVREGHSRGCDRDT